MPNQVVPKADDNEGYSWLHIDDFTPGLFTANATGTPAGAQTNYTPQPLGSCSAVEACIGQPNGGLVPLPWFPETPREWPYGTIDTPFIFIAGVETNTAYRLNYLMSGDTEETELISIVEADDGSTFHLVAVNSYIIETGDIHAVLHSVSASTETYWGSPYPQWTRMTEVGSGLDYPVLVFPSVVPTDSQGQNGHMYVYPLITAPTTFNVEDLVAESTTPGAFTGQLVCYDGRILGLIAPNTYTWPDRGDSPLFISNEAIEYSDPPGSNDYFPTTDDFALLVPENPFGYGAVGSISAGELFLVKKRGGGVLVLGDIDAPSSVTYLPGVQPTGNFYGRGDSTQLGFVYCSQGFGAWVWNGANVSQKISTQLQDDFFDVLDEAGLSNSENYGFFVKRWGDFILFSNGYVYSILTSSWWMLTQPGAGEHPYYHYTDAKDNHQIYVMPLKVDVTNETFLYTFDTRIGAPHYEWTSTDLYRHVTNIQDRVIDIREVIIKASVAVPASGNTITCNLIQNDTIVATQTSDTPVNVDPTTIRFNFGAKGLENFKIQFLSDSPEQTPGSSTAAPSIWSFEFAYRARAKVKSDQ